MKQDPHNDVLDFAEVIGEALGRYLGEVKVATPASETDVAVSLGDLEYNDDEEDTKQRTRAQ